MWTLDPYGQNLQKQIWYSEKRRFYGQLKVAGLVEKINKNIAASSDKTGSSWKHKQYAISKNTNKA